MYNVGCNQNGLKVTVYSTNANNALIILIMHKLIKNNSHDTLTNTTSDFIIIFIFTGAQPKAGTGHKMQSLSVVFSMLHC